MLHRGADRRHHSVPQLVGATATATSFLALAGKPERPPMTSATRSLWPTIKSRLDNNQLEHCHRLRLSDCEGFLLSQRRQEKLA